MNPRLWWYVARGSGIVAWVLVTASVVWGLALSTRLTRRPKPAWVLDLHRFLGGLSVVFVGVHVVGLVADSYTHFGPTDVLVPFASAWHPAAVATGVVGMYLLVAIELTSLAMRRLPRRFWHAVHLTSFGLFALTTAHALTAGTDASSPAARWFALASSATVVFLTLIRVLARRGGRSAGRSASRTNRGSGRDGQREPAGDGAERDDGVSSTIATSEGPEPPLSLPDDDHQNARPPFTSGSATSASAPDARAPQPGFHRARRRTSPVSCTSARCGDRRPLPTG